ncbi:hypothetical protein AGMMS49965_00720 [Bacteroidia bacterium]|nr:hypothetical protein AGMMS49965_00720 [Bacteroidia bacterium]
METTKKCPYCGEEIKMKAIKCRHCKTMLVNNPDVPLSEEEKIHAGSEVEFIPGAIPLLEKFAFLWIFPKKWTLELFKVKDGILTIRVKNGTFIETPLAKTSTTLNKSEFYTDYKVKTEDGGKIYFRSYGHLEKEDWEKISKILHAQEGGLSKKMGVVSKILGWIRDLIK